MSDSISVLVYFQFPLLGSISNAPFCSLTLFTLSIPFVGFGHMGIPDWWRRANYLSIPFVGFINVVYPPEINEMIDFQFPLLGSDTYPQA